MLYIYILYSTSSDLYYVGYSDNPVRRLEEHNNSPKSTFTSKHRPWVIKAIFEGGNSSSEAMRMERFIKKQKSRKLIENLRNPDFIPRGELAGLIRVPDVRD